MPLCPLLGFSDAGKPLLNVRISGDEAASQSPEEIVRRMGLASPLLLVLPSNVIEAKPTDGQASMLRASTCIVGPCNFAQADGPRAWLEAGAKYALFCAPAAGSPAALAAAVTVAAKDAAIPAERLLMLLNVPDNCTS